MSIGSLEKFFQITQELVFLYPFAMSWIWMAGAVIFYILRERQYPLPDTKPNLHHYPFVSVLIPCHNEGEQINETIHSFTHTEYPPDRFEVIAINDGSTDDTAEKLDKLAEEYPFLRAVHLAENKGKALALKTGCLMSKGEVMVCIDGDAILEPNAVLWLVKRLQLSPRVGAVTGNPRIRNRSTLLGRLQVGEFSIIIGLIKRTQSVYGRLFTISGVVAAFRKQALHDIGYWSPEMLTDDIDITWKLQQAGYYVRYAPNALCWILMPETLKGLWSQRMRWAQGAGETALKYGTGLFVKKRRRMIPIFLEYMFSVIWAHAIIITGCILLYESVFQYDLIKGVDAFLPTHWGVLMGMTFFLQSLIAMTLERRYEPDIFKNFLWMIWYPLIYWTIMALTATFGFYRALFLGRKKLATWVSPDRGFS
jgi:biofilm PGA synthesis N-glycosyltransferase PgaC